MNLDDAILSRRSIRSFAHTPIDEQTIRSIIEAARLSPSAKNRQPWYFEVLDEEKKEALADALLAAAQTTCDKGAEGTASIMREAPAVIVVYARREGTTDLLSIGAAMYAMCLKATDMGLGSLWIGDTDILREDASYREIIGAVLVGHAAEYPPQRSRKPLETISNLLPETSTSATDDIANATLNDSKYVFISYSHRDRDAVVADIRELKHHGIPLWYDKALVYGEKWDEHAIKMIEGRNCCALTMYITINSLSSEAVFKEFKTATARVEQGDFAIIPIVIGEESVSQLIAQLKERGLNDMAAEYERYFGEDNQTLYVSRSRIPAHLTHIERLLDACSTHHIIVDHRVYDNFNYAITDGGCVVTEYHGTAEIVRIPDCISGYSVVEVGQNAFTDNKTIRKVIVPTSVKRMGLGAFLGSTLAEIVIPDSVEVIDTACFRDCTHLRHIHLPPRITYLAEALFRGCSSLLSIDVPYGVTEMKEAVFRNCYSLEKAVLPPSLKRMTEGGFYGCAHLVDLVIPADVEGVEIQSFDTSPLLNRVVVGGFIFEKGQATPV